MIPFLVEYSFVQLIIARVNNNTFNWEFQAQARVNFYNLN